MFVSNDHTFIGIGPMDIKTSLTDMKTELALINQAIAALEHLAELQGLGVETSTKKGKSKFATASEAPPARLQS